MQRIRVDLPDPEGPHSTIFSPARTVRLMSVRALYWPYHFSMPSMAIMGEGLGATVAACVVMALAPACGQPATNGMPSRLSGKVGGSSFIHLL